MDCPFGMLHFFLQKLQTHVALEWACVFCDSTVTYLHNGVLFTSSTCWLSIVDSRVEALLVGALPFPLCLEEAP